MKDVQILKQPNESAVYVHDEEDRTCYLYDYYLQMNVTSVKTVGSFKKSPDKKGDKYRINIVKVKEGGVSESAMEENYEIVRKHLLENIERKEALVERL